MALEISSGEGQNCQMALESMRKARKAKKLTQEKLAEEIGISNGQISRFETGKRRPRFDEMIKISQRLAIPLEVLKKEIALIPAEPGDIDDVAPAPPLIVELEAEFQRLLTLPPNKLVDLYLLICAASRLANVATTEDPPILTLSLSEQLKYLAALEERHASLRSSSQPETPPLPRPPIPSSARKGR